MARHTRYPAGDGWLPEFFKQEGANTGVYRDPTPEEAIMQWYRMFVDRKISRNALDKALGERDPEDFNDFYKKHPAIMEADLVFLSLTPRDEEYRETLRPHVGRIWS